MKNLLLITLIICNWMFFSCKSPSQEKHDHSDHQVKIKESDAKSPHKIAMNNIGDTHVHIEYNAPSVRNRIIWGGLVPYDQVWVTGAHTATFVEFYGDVEIDKKLVKRGKYGFFTIPGKEKWILILNKRWNQHLTDEYNPSEDIIRWDAVPDSVDFIEQLTYSVNPKDSLVSIGWDNLKVSFQVNPVR